MAYRKMTISVTPEIFEGLHRTVKKGQISSFICEKVRPYLLEQSLEKEYRELAKDEAAQKEALEWSENCLNSLEDETFETW